MTFEGAVPFHEVRSWFQPAHKAAQNKILWRLKQLNILQGRGQEVWMNEVFQAALFTGFSKKSLQEDSGTTSTVVETRIDDFSRTQWEAVLYELVKGEDGGMGNMEENANGKRSKISSQSKLDRLLKDSELISNSGRVTNAGFQFLLRDISSQVWILLIHYLGGLPSGLLEANLLFIAELVLYAQAGHCLASTSVDLGMFERFGLVMRRGDVFVATRLFTSLSGGKNALDFSQMGGDGAPGFLVVETNYRIYAYTSSPLQIATLALFIRLQDRFPNLVYGQLDMDTVQRAMSHGITADQIIRYLQVNVHPCMTLSSDGNVPFNGIPFTVIDQIKLWEQNRNRLIHRDGFLYQQFLSEREFDSTLTEAKRINALLYAKPTNRLLIISPEGHEQMKQFLKSIK